MGARQSRRSVDITTTPKKEGAPAEGGVGDAAAPGDGKLERIEETDTKPTTNGIAPHTDVTEDKDKDKDDATEKDKEKQEEVKAEETKQESAGESPAESAEATTPTEASPASPNVATSPESKETKKKDKMKKKWSFRSISFSKKDKSKPAREEAPKNGDVTKEEPLAEGGEETENGSATAGSPAEEKSAVSSPSVETEAAPVSAATPSTETKEDAAAATAASSPTEEKQEEPTPSAPTPVPVEEKKEEVEKVEAENKVVEVSPAGGQFVPDPVEVSVFRVQTVATPSIIERKTSEDIPSEPPSSPPPTPIDPSPLQQAQQAAATATALAEALKLPAEAADKHFTESITLSSSSPERNEQPANITRASDPAPTPPASSAHESPAETNPPLSPKVEALPVVDANNSEVTVHGNVDSVADEVQAQLSVESEANNPEDATEQPSPPESTSKECASVSSVSAENETMVTDKNTVDVEPVSNLVSEQVKVIEPVSSVVSEKVEVVKPVADVVSEKVEVVKPVSNVKTEKVEVVEPVVNVESEKVEIVEPVANVESEKSEVVEPLVECVATVDVDSAAQIENKAAEVVTESVDQLEPVESVKKEVQETATSPERNEKLVEQVVELIEVVQEEATRVEEVIVDPPVSVSDSFVDSEEGPVPLSEEMVVEAKPAVVIPEDEEVEAAIETEANVSTVRTESVEVVADVEDKMETETEADSTAPTEEVVVLQDPLVPDKETVDPVLPLDEIVSAVEAVVANVTDETVQYKTEELTPPPIPESPVPTPKDKYDFENVENEPTTVPSQSVDLEPQVLEVNQTEEMEKESSETEETMDCSLSEIPPPPPVDASQIPNSPVKDTNESQTLVSSSRLDETVPIPTDELPPSPLNTTSSQCVTNSECPLPPEELSSSLAPNNVSEIKSELPVPDEHACSLRNPTETLLTPPRSPSPQSNISIASGLTTSTKDSSQTQLYDDQSNREFKMESVSISLNSYNESDIELKERLAESLAETENQEGSSVSCQLSNNATSSTTIQETHQSTPESEAPVENNVVHELSTTESSDETPKVITPAVPTEVPAVFPPSAPAITEDVASVAKAIEELDISDKAVAAATIECNTNEIIADAPYQNDINE